MAWATPGFAVLLIHLESASPAIRLRPTTRSNSHSWMSALKMVRSWEDQIRPLTTNPATNRWLHGTIASRAIPSQPRSTRRTQASSVVSSAGGPTTSTSRMDGMMLLLQRTRSIGSWTSTRILTTFLTSLESPGLLLRWVSVVVLMVHGRMQPGVEDDG